MSFAERLRIETPMLIDGRRMDRRTFHAIYSATPPGIRAELIRGVIHMPSPVGRDHGKETSRLNGWLLRYERATKGAEAFDNASILLDDFSEVQPDGFLRIAPARGGRTSDEGGFVAGGPELVVEVARSSRFVDLGPKRAEYEHAGVLEYVVRAMEPDEVLWHVRIGDVLAPVEPDSDGVHRSRVFPGLWLDPAALLAGDLEGLFTTLERGLASAEHAEFVAKLDRADRS